MLYVLAVTQHYHYTPPQLPAAHAPELVSSVLLHMEPYLTTLQAPQLSQLVWALKQLQHSPPEVRMCGQSVSALLFVVVYVAVVFVFCA